MATPRKNATRRKATAKAPASNAGTGKDGLKRANTKAKPADPKAKPKKGLKTSAQPKAKAPKTDPAKGKTDSKAHTTTGATEEKTAKPKVKKTSISEKRRKRSLVHHAIAKHHRGLKKGPIRVGQVRVQRGEKRMIHLKVSEHYTGQPVDIPVTVIRGTKTGPRLFLTAAIHGDEINGVQIIREVIDGIEPEDLRGTIIAAPVVNRFGFVAHTRYMPDRRDLNRCFPGSADGATAYRYAHEVFQHIVAPCDYGIDLHTAGYQRHNLPQIRGDMNHPDIRRMAKAFGAEVILDKMGAKGTLRQEATEAGIPTIIYEAGETFRFQRQPITKGVTGVLNVMRDLGMLSGELERPEFQVITKTSAWLRADHGGIMETYVDAGTVVHEGEAIAQVNEPFGASRGLVRAPFNGLVVGVTTLPMVNPGAPICHLVKLSRHLDMVREAIGPDIVSVHGPEHPVDVSQFVESAGTPEEDETEG